PCVFYQRPRFRRLPVDAFSSCARHLNDTGKSPSTSVELKTEDSQKDLPSNEQLFYVDWLTDLLVPKFLSDRALYVKFMQLCTKDIVYDDQIFNRHTE
ncbi:unnamed protein product, partial [Gongylonema pulchrum]|uniref:RGS domain-containing protein n=1 Tax=Gongylonema pulchrum TaxID=637853 RepID=A0A183EGM5_9BILA